MIGSKFRGKWLMALAAFAYLLLFQSTITAQIITPFTVRYTNNIEGDIELIGNGLMTCPSGSGNCAAAQAGGSFSNNSFEMTYIDIDGDAATFNSSNARLKLPTGATVLFAGLYWGGDTAKGVTGGSGSTAPNPTARNQVKLKVPRARSYKKLNGTLIGVRNTDYQAFIDVTEIVKKAGNGTYTVADVQAGTGADRYAGWSLVVAYADASLKAHNLTVFDGYANVTSGTNNVIIPVSGFITPLNGSVHTDVGVVAYEGDISGTGDRFLLNDTLLSDGLNSSNNFFNSSITDLGQYVTTRKPEFVNNLGFDINHVKADDILGNAATDATMTLTTNLETYFPGVVTFATELYVPNIEVVKTATNVTRDTGENLRGDILEYTVTVNNSSLDSAINFVLEDAIPDNTTYVNGSLQILTGANQGAKTDVSGDDQAEYNSTDNKIVFRLGANANAVTGGTLATDDQTSISFQVRIADDIATGAKIDNQANTTYTTATLKLNLTEASNLVELQVDSVDEPIIGVVKISTNLTNDTGENFPGDILEYTVTIDNSGPGSATNFVLEDAIPAETSYVAGSLQILTGTNQGAKTDVSGDDQAEYDPAGNKVIFRLGADANAVTGGSLAVDAQISISFQIRIDAEVSSDTISNKVNTSYTAINLNQKLTKASNQVDDIVSNVAVPEVQIVKAGVNLTQSTGENKPGDILEYEITVINTSKERATNFVLEDAIPTNTTYVADSLRILIGVNEGVKTDASGDDQAEYDESSNKVVFRLGVGADAVTGGTLTNDEGVTAVAFQVRIADDTAIGTEIFNQATVTYSTETLKLNLVEISDLIDFLITPVPCKIKTFSATNHVLETLSHDEIVTTTGCKFANETFSADSIITSGKAVPYSIGGLSLLANGALPATLGEVTIKVEDSTGSEFSADIFHVSPTEIDWLMPNGLADGLATVTFSQNGDVLVTEDITIAKVSQGIFTANAIGSGIPVGIVLRLKSDGTEIKERLYTDSQAMKKATAIPIKVNNLLYQSQRVLRKVTAIPIDLGESSDQLLLALCGTGFRHHPSIGTITAKIGETPVEIYYNGPTPGHPGLDQVNIFLPHSLKGRGEVPVTVSFAGQTVNVTTINIK